ncbi:hypothetical protein UNPF46_25260 [Bradyrhizobium sp. UNPF46]|uniref:hypothetical protein n=1 Tax=Bradyrhizobium sp. UNPF46 TaxID=1141168 RepID=UPI001151D73C|nr:hypothetical protein [Bradyrhizobium sp. UNPF46]TQF35309.1 hypothetical protein UNPF46_25260 [Bradyrhizobium sp. UNPF46]
MRLLVAMALIVAATAARAATFEGGANSSECKELTARLAEATNATFDHYSPSGNNVFLKNPDMVLSCMTHRLTGVSLTWDKSGFPPNEWFGLLARAGNAVTRVDVKTLEAESRKCHRAALKDKSELADLDIPNAKIECQAFIRDGGGVNIHIWMNDREARKGIEER